ncbi:MAG: hypothetical protein KC619_28195, partial [Myxococcales bacterium]|nr:hypothetical protein [Myxococcales bacterium]
VAFWSEGVGIDQDLLMQPLTPVGARSGAPVTVSVEANADGSVDAAVSPGTGGAVVFGVLVSGVRKEVRFRAMSADGTLLGDEVPLMTPPATGGDASIVPFAGGYAVAYRGDLGGGAGTQIVLLLVDGLGNVLDEAPLTSASEGGGRLTLRATGTGQLAVTWADDTPSGYELNVQLIRCGG